MCLPVFIINLCLIFPVSLSFNEYGHFGDIYDSISKTFYSSSSEGDSVSDNNSSVPDNDNDNETFEGVTQESFNEFQGNFRTYLENVETHNIEVESKINIIYEFLKYITGFVLFIILVLLLKYIYKLFNIFF